MLHLAAGDDVAAATEALKSGCGWTDSNSYVAQAFLKFTMPSITLNAWSSCLYLPNARITGKYHYAQFMKYWGLNTGPCIVEASTIPTGQQTSLGVFILSSMKRVMVFSETSFPQHYQRRQLGKSAGPILVRFLTIPENSTVLTGNDKQMPLDPQWPQSVWS